MTARRSSRSVLASVMARFPQILCAAGCSLAVIVASVVVHPMWSVGGVALSGPGAFSRVVAGRGVVSRRIPHGIPRSCGAQAGAASTTAETASRSFYSAAAVATWVARLPGHHPTEADERGLPTARNDGSSPKNRPGLLSTTNATNIRLPHAEHNGGFIFSGVVMHPI